MNAIELAEYLEDYGEYERATDIEAADMLAQLAEPAVQQCGYDETTGNCTKNPCCYTSPPPPAEVPLLSNELIDTLADAHRSVLNGSPYFAWYDYARKIEQAVRNNAGLK